MLDPLALLGAFSLMIIVGFLSDLLFKKTLVPDTIPLILLGIILGPLLGILPVQSLKPLIPLVGSLALIVILLDQGMELSYASLLKGAPRSVVLALSTFLFSTLLIGLLSCFLLRLSLLVSFMLGATLGGTSSVIVAPFLEKLHLHQRVRTVLLLDSVVTDVLCIVVVLVLCTLGKVAFAEMGRQLGVVFLAALALGTVVGIPWLVLMPRLQDMPSFYALMLAVGVAVYVSAEGMGASGGVAVLAFGLTMGNASKLGRMLRITTVPLGSEARRFHDEVTFLIRTLFLVCLGAMVDRGILSLLPPCIALFLAAILARMAAAKVTSLHDPLLKENESLVGLLLPKGLAAAVLSYFPSQYGFAGTEVFPGIVVCLILLTNILSMVVSLRVKIG
jgi:NhaP-type Na+/H+ or K+/H+ antiporter